MKIIFTLSFLLFLLPLASWCQEGTVDSSGVRKLRIDPNAARGASVSALFQQVEYVPLETTKASLFGEVSQLEIVNGKFVIFDQDTWSVLIFAQNGKFLTRISAKRVAEITGLDYAKENIGTLLTGFTVSRSGTEHLINISSKKGILRFDMEGKLRSTLSFGQFQKVIYLADGTKVIPDFTRDKKKYYEFAIAGEKGDTTGYLPYSPRRYAEDDFIIGGNRVNIGSDPNLAFYYGYYSYGLFELSGRGASLKYQILLPEAIALPQDFTTNPIYAFKKWDYLRREKNRVYGLRNPLVVGNSLILTLDAVSQLQATKKTIAYNLGNGQLFSLQDISPDQMSYFLPINDSAYGTNFMMRGFSAYDGTSLYTSISSVSMLKFKELSKTDVTYPEALRQYFARNNADANPVMVILKPKSVN
jgi:hypothetical protein